MSGSGVQLEAAQEVIIFIRVLAMVVSLPEGRGLLVELAANAAWTRLRPHPTLSVEDGSTALAPEEASIHTKNHE